MLATVYQYGVFSKCLMHPNDYPIDHSNNKSLTLKEKYFFQSVNLILLYATVFVNHLMMHCNVIIQLLVELQTLNSAKRQRNNPV